MAKLKPHEAIAIQTSDMIFFELRPRNSLRFFSERRWKKKQFKSQPKKKDETMNNSSPITLIDSNGE